METAKRILLLVIGIAAIVLSIVCYAHSVGSSESDKSYGGDAYSGIQNAAAQTACNVQMTNEILSFGFGSVLLVSGLTICTIGIFGTTNKKEEKEEVKEVSEELPTL